MLSSGTIDLAIGLAFIFGTTAALSSAITELIARFLGLRGAYLLQGLRELLDTNQVATELKDVQDDYNVLTEFIAGKIGGARPVIEPKSATGALLGSPILNSQGMVGQISDRTLTLTRKSANNPNAARTQVPAAKLPKISVGDRGRPLHRLTMLRSLPSYISGSSFADAVIDTIVPDPKQETTMDTIRICVDNLPDSLETLKKSLQALVHTAGDDINQFRTLVEEWYDDHMDRVSGWYKRHVAKITLVVGAILVLLLNINTITIGRTLYSDSTIRAAVSSVAAKSTSCPTGQNQPACLANLEAQLRAAAQAGMPLGWATVPDCAKPNSACNWLDQRGILSRHGGSAWELTLFIIGFLITIIALVPGARFWFDLLTKLGSLRSTGPKPTTQA